MPTDWRCLQAAFGRGGKTMIAIPAYIQNQLSEAPPVHPGRHDAWERLSLQMVGEGIPDDVTFSELRRWIPDSDKTDAELWALIKGAYALNPKPATGNGTSAISRPLKYNRKSNGQ